MFGGTFDPPHLAHRKLIEALLKQNLFDQLIVVPSHFPPGKTAQAPFASRLRWTRETFKDLENVMVSDFESPSKTTVFATDIFHHFLKQYSSAQFFWILGDDQWEQIPYWHQIDSYASSLTWIVLSRQASHPEQKRSFDGLKSRRLLKSTCAYRHVEAPLFPTISSSALRESLSVLRAESHANAELEADELKWIPESIRDEVLSAYQNHPPLSERRIH